MGEEASWRTSLIGVGLLRENLVSFALVIVHTNVIIVCDLCGGDLARADLIHWVEGNVSGSWEYLLKLISLGGALH